MNMWGFTPHVFHQLGAYFRDFLRTHGTDLRAECYLPSAVNHFVQSGQARVRILPTKDSWFGVTYREDRPTVVESIRKLIAKGEYPEKLWG